jgi:hypothetical protein
MITKAAGASKPGDGARFQSAGRGRTCKDPSGISVLVRIGYSYTRVGKAPSNDAANERQKDS